MPNALCHFELMPGDAGKCRAFYGEVFDWQFDDQSMPGYTLIHTGAEPSGGLLAKPPSAPKPCFNVYFHVEDVSGTLQRAVKLGAKTLMAPKSIPNVGEVAMFADPEGIVIGLFKPTAT